MSNLKLTADDISIINGYYSKSEAIQAVAENMIKSGLVKDDYTLSLIHI